MDVRLPQDTSISLHKHYVQKIAWMVTTITHKNRSALLARDVTRVVLIQLIANLVLAHSTFLATTVCQFAPTATMQVQVIISVQLAQMAVPPALVTLTSAASLAKILLRMCPTITRLAAAVV
jgi:hypothetical protein